MQLYKRYVDVICLQEKSGDIRPLWIRWEDGCNYAIDKVKNMGNRASEVGGCGVLFLCMIQGQQRKLYYEKGVRWFIESYQP
ncbi:MAG: hypothetical protein HUJ56_07830 [Erysipelotrichaceae bacterium]|nr:hypothetical protein [Erysipelotrichaceae bacterium]